MDSLNIEWLAEEPDSGSSSPVSREPFSTEGDIDVDSPILSRGSNDSFGDEKLFKYQKQDNVLLKTSLKNISLAKKRLQAYSSSYINKTPAKGETQEDNPEKNSKKTNKACHPDDKAKAIIQEIENIKKLETSHSIRCRSKSLSPEVVNHFKKREIKRRNYRRTDSDTRICTSPVDLQRKNDRRPLTNQKNLSFYPKNWTEYKEKRLTISKDDELKAKCFPKVNHTISEIFNKLYNFTAPSVFLESFKYSAEQQTKTIPISFLRSTKSKPPVIYSMNSERKKECYMSRTELFQIIPKKREELIQNLLSKQPKLEPANSTHSNRLWYNKAWKKPGNQVCKVIENSVGLSFLQNYSDEEEDDETEDIIVCSSVKKSDMNTIETQENNSEKHDQTPPPECTQDTGNPGVHKETAPPVEFVNVRKEDILTGEGKSEERNEERLTPERIVDSVETFENNDVSLTPERFEFDHKKNPLDETRIAIQKIEKELEVEHLELINEPQEPSGSRNKKKKKKSESKNKNDSSREDGDISKTKKKKKKKRNKKLYVDDDSPYSEVEKHKKSKREKRKEKTNKKKHKNTKHDSNKSRKKEVSEDAEEIHKSKSKLNDIETETKVFSGGSHKKNKKKVKKERHRHSDDEFEGKKVVSEKMVSDEEKTLEFFEPKIIKNRHEEIVPSEDLRNLLQELEKRKEVTNNQDCPNIKHSVHSQSSEKIHDSIEQKRKSKKEKYWDDRYITEAGTPMKDIELKIKRDEDRKKEERTDAKEHDVLVDSLKKRSLERLYPEELFETDYLKYNTIKIKQEHDWEGDEKKKKLSKKKKGCPNILDDFPLEKDVFNDAVNYKGGTPDTEDYRGNWESDDEITVKATEKPNTSWESEDEIVESNRSAEKQRDYTEMLDLQIPLNFKPFTRREPKIIQFKLELPEIESQVHSPGIIWAAQKHENTINDAVTGIEELQSEMVADVKIENIEDVGMENSPKRRRSQDECSNETKKSRWDKRNAEEPVPTDLLPLEVLQEAISPVDTPKVFENVPPDAISLVNSPKVSENFLPDAVSPVDTTKVSENVLPDSISSVDTTKVFKNVLRDAISPAVTPKVFENVLPDAISPVDTTKVLENEYEEFMKAVSTTVVSTSSTSALNDSVISLSSDSNGSLEIPAPGRKFFNVGLGHASTPIKIDLSKENETPPVVIAPQDIPFIPMPGEVKVALKDIPFIPMPGEVKPVVTGIPLIPMPGEIKPVPLPNVVVDTTATPLISLSLLSDIAPVLLPLSGSQLNMGMSLPGEHVTAAAKENDIAVKDCETPCLGGETFVNVSDTPVNVNKTPVVVIETPLIDCEKPVKGSETSTKADGMTEEISDAILESGETPASSTPVKIAETSVKVSEVDTSTQEETRTTTNQRVIEKPFSLVLPLKKTLVNSRLNFGDSDDEADKSKKTIDEIKMENLVTLAEIEKGEEKETLESRSHADKEVGKSYARKKERTRSRSPLSKKSSSEPKLRTERKSSDSQGSSKAKRRDSSPRRRDGSPRRREKSPRRRGSSPRRRDSSPKKRGHSPKRSSPPRRRSSPGRRRYSSSKSTSPGHRRRSLSPRKKSPKRGGSSPRSSSKHTKRTRSKSPKRTDSTGKTRESTERTNDKKRAKSESSKKSLADSTIPDESLLPQGSTEQARPPTLVDYSKEKLSSISTTYDNFSYEQKHFPHVMQSMNHFAQTSSAERNSQSNFVQMGNMVQIVPTDLHMKTDYVRTDSYMSNKDIINQKQKMQIVQVGNMLQIVPTELPPLPPFPPLPPEEPKKEPLELLEYKLEKEKQSAEMTMKQKVAERRAERDKRRLERETRRREKERRRREKEKDRQVKLKQRTEKMIKRALELEVEGGGESSLLNETPAQWPPLPAVVGCSKESKGILVRGQRSIKSPRSDKRKNVQFADGIRPGEGTSPSAGEELSSPLPCRILPKEKRYTKTKLRKNKKRKVKVKIIKSIETENSEEEDNLPPPSPPPGSPPPHIFPSRIKPQPTVVSNILSQYVPNMAALQQSIQSPVMYRQSPMNVVMGHPGTQLHRSHMPLAQPQRHMGVHAAEAIAHHHGIPPMHIAPPPPPPPPPTSRPGTPLGSTHRNLSYHYQM